MEQKDNNGVLFRNTGKQSANQPDYTGNAVVNGKAVSIAAWVKQSQKGTNYLSLAFNEPRPQQGQPQQGQQMPPTPPVAPSPAPAPKSDPAGDLPF